MVLLVLGASAIIFIFLLRLLSGKEVRTLNGSTAKLIGLLVFLNLLNLIYTKNPYHTRIALTFNVGSLILLVAVAIYGKPRWILWAIVGAGFLVAIQSVLEAAGWNVLFRGPLPKTQIVSTIGNSNFLGAYLIFPIYSALALLFSCKQKRYFAFLLTALTVLFAALVLSRARAAWLSVSIVFPFFLFFALRIRQIKIGWSKVAVYGLCLATLFFGIYLSAPARFNSVLNPKLLFETTTLKLRILKYSRPSFELFKQSPLVGTGMWSYRNELYETQAMLNKKDPGFFKNYVLPKPRRAHNEYLEVLNDGGLLVAFVLAGLLVSVFRHGVLVTKTASRTNEDRLIALGCITAVTATMIDAFFFFPFRVCVTVSTFALMLGVIERLHTVSTARTYRIPRLSRMIFRAVIPVLLVFWIWQSGFRHLVAERYWRNHRVAIVKNDMENAEQNILRALKFDPFSTEYNYYAATFFLHVVPKYQRALHHAHTALYHFNGDIVLWAVHFARGMINYKLGNVAGAYQDFQKTLELNPSETQAENWLKKLDQIYDNHKKVIIELHDREG